MPTGVNRPKKGPLVCAKCGNEKSREEFRMVRYSDMSRRPRRHSYCNACLRIQVRLDVAKHRLRHKRRR